MAALAQPAMLVSFIEYMPRQCLRQSLPIATQCAVASSRALYFDGCIIGSSAIFIMGSSPVCAKAFEAEAATATVPAAAINSRRSIIDFLPLVQISLASPQNFPKFYREMLMDRKRPYRTFRVLKYHLGGFTDDELRKVLVRAGGIRLTAGGQEVWGLLSRNHECLSVEEINEAPTTQIALDTCAQQQKLPQHDGGPQDELDLPRNSSGAFARVRAEMIKLGTLECVRPSVRHE